MEVAPLTLGRALDSDDAIFSGGKGTSPDLARTLGGVTTEAEQQRMRVEYEAQLEQLKEQNRTQQEAERMALEKYKADLQAQTAIVTAQIAAKQQNDAALMAAEQQANEGASDGV